MNRHKLLSCRCAKGALNKRPDDDKESFDGFDDYNPAALEEADRGIKERLSAISEINERFSRIAISDRRRENYTGIATGLIGYLATSASFDGLNDGVSGLKFYLEEVGEVAIFDERHRPILYPYGNMSDEARVKLISAVRERYPDVEIRYTGGKK